MKLYNKIIVVAFFIPFLLVFGILIRGQKAKSKLENRSYEMIPNFNINDFKDGTYQDQLESALSDQILFSDKIKINKRKIYNLYVSNVSSKLLNKTQKPCYIKVFGNYYNYGQSNYLIVKPKDSYNINYYKDIYNSININEKYIYFIEKDRTIDFTKFDLKDKYFEEIKNNCNAKAYSKFTLNSFSDLEKYFYQTDHHWNHLGQLRGYKEIISLLLGSKEKTLNPIKEVTYDVIFNGSASRISLTRTSVEKFKVYKYSLPKYRTFINDEEKEYGNPLIYDQGKFSKRVYANHYGVYYGGDYAKIEYDFNNPKKDNLLVIATSYSNSINNLIASHFNKTFVIDLRHYEKQYNTQIDFNNFIKENKIDKVLIMGDIYSFDMEEI